MHNHKVMQQPSASKLYPFILLPGKLLLFVAYRRRPLGPWDPPGDPIQIQISPFLPLQAVFQTGQFVLSEE